MVFIRRILRMIYDARLDIYSSMAVVIARSKMSEFMSYGVIKDRRCRGINWSIFEITMLIRRNMRTICDTLHRFTI